MQGDVGDHVAAALPRWRLGESVFAAVEHTDSGGAVDLMAREDEEVGAEFLQVDRQMRHRLCAVDEHTCAISVCDLDDLLGRGHRSQRVGNLSGRNQFGAWANQIFQLGEQQVAGIVHRGHLDHGAGLLRNQLPRNDIGVVFQVGDDDLVAVPQVLAAPGIGHQIDGLGGAAHEDDVLVGFGAQELAGRPACVLVRVGGACRQLMCGAVDVRVLVLVEVHQPVDHGLGLLRGGGVVEPDQRLAVDGLGQDGEVRPDGGDVEGACVLAGGCRGRRPTQEVVVRLVTSPATTAGRRRGRPSQIRYRQPLRIRSGPRRCCERGRGRARQHARECG
ncbi:Uncharacterised protein [Mycobacteroides abscessus subsp. massiliense]|nr:Uncharacterised protein [Mycobacteroides abscessus subsp. massiliense]